MTSRTHASRAKVAIAWRRLHRCVCRLRSDSSSFSVSLSRFFFPFFLFFFFSQLARVLLVAVLLPARASRASRARVTDLNSLRQRPTNKIPSGIDPKPPQISIDSAEVHARLSRATLASASCLRAAALTHARARSARISGTSANTWLAQIRPSHPRSYVLAYGYFYRSRIRTNLTIRSYGSSSDRNYLSTARSIRWA